MKNIFITTFILFTPCLLWAQTFVPTNGGALESKDRFILTLSSQDSSSVVNIRINTSHAAEYGSGDAYILDINKVPLAFSSLILNNGTMSHCVTDSRGLDEYSNNYYVDFPLNANMAKDNQTQYTFHVDTLGTIALKYNKAAVIFRLIDKQEPDEFINLLEGDYTFTSVADEGNERFSVRVYAACLWKKEKTSGNWNDPANWYGGKVPGLAENSARTNNAAIIPAGTSITIPADITIGSLFNSGQLTIQTGVNVTIKADAKLISVSDMY
jgi:hypothetical protein